MRTIWKFPMVIADYQQIMMPRFAHIISCQFQGEQLCLWAEVSPAEKLEPRQFVIFGTGHSIRDELIATCLFVATVQKGSLVYHVYEGDRG